ncbi:MAG TPA: ankyrin repeat domain-containing protein [Gemmataceae bacterium]|jgi:truncated hemoglobin YjbI/ankyrin repeat protein|nr:ankyrin repeat domain-containing protein [Gemmataceae bacterium]
MAKPPPVGVNLRADADVSLYDRIGDDRVERLVAAFYARVDRDPVIRRFYGKTLTCAIHALTDFMTTWLGGPSVYNVRGARLRRRHRPFAIDARARDAWLANMRAAVRDVGIPTAEADILLAHFEFGAKALVNTGKSSGPVRINRSDARLAEQWDRMTEAEALFDAIANGDLELVQSTLPLRLVPHAELMCYALQPDDRRSGRQPKQAKPLEMIECLLAHRDLDCEFDAGDNLGRFRHLQAAMQAYALGCRLIESTSPMHADFRSATRDRFIAEIERDHSCVQLLGSRGQTLLHDAARVGEAELAAALIHAGANPDAKEWEGHPPLYRALNGEVARVLLEAGATVDVASGPTRGTPLHQAARHGHASVAQALLDHGAAIDARDSKGETPLRRAVNCRRLDVVRLLIQHGADPHAADRRGKTPLDAARTDEMKRALVRLRDPIT